MLTSSLLMHVHIHAYIPIVACTHTPACLHTHTHTQRIPYLEHLNFKERDGRSKNTPGQNTLSVSDKTQLRCEVATTGSTGVWLGALCDATALRVPSHPNPPVFLSPCGLLRAPATLCPCAQDECSTKANLTTIMF